MGSAGAGDSPGDQGGDLQIRVDPARAVDPHVLGDEPLQTGSLHELQHRRQTRARHQVRIIEDAVKP